MTKQAIQLKVRIRAILRNLFFKLCIHIGFWFSVGCLIMCFIGNTFNLNASEASGFFQGIVTFFSIISGFLYINYERIQQQTEQEGRTKQNIRKRFRLIKLSIPNLAKIKQLFSDNKEESGSSLHTTFTECIMILISLRDTFSDEAIENIKEAYRETKLDLIDVDASNESILSLETFRMEFEVANDIYNELQSKVSLHDNPKLIINNYPIIYSHASKIDAHLKVCQIKIDDIIKLMT